MLNLSIGALLKRAWYENSFSRFGTDSAEHILGTLTANCDVDLLPAQRDAWLAQIGILRECVRGLNGHLFLEFVIPRMGRRIDTVLVIGPAVFVVEFKIGEHRFDRDAIEQVWDYALDLKNFHEASHSADIVPILVATEAEAPVGQSFVPDCDRVFRPVLSNASALRALLQDALAVTQGPNLDAETWGRAPYRPTPTIIEAARSLYAQHSVEAIARFDAGAQNLSITSRRIEQLVDEARARKRKYICFVTGVPGAGKTLVGLNLATRRHEVDSSSHAVFLSGNGPLVAVLREALTRDEFARRRLRGERVRKGEIAKSVHQFIQNVHHFRDEGLRDPAPPPERVVIFDEAQRAWNLTQTANFMRRRKKRPGFNMSEPEFLISVMDRRQDWAVVVCLVGGGQEINTGEAGIGAWLEAVHRRFDDWHMFISSRLEDSEYAAGHALDLVRGHRMTTFDDSLHLAVSMRSFRSENVSAFVKALLDCDRQKARRLCEEITERYPVVITRDLSAAKHWIRSRARGSERYGLVASSKAMRLKPLAIDIRVAIDPVHYFLNDRTDTRSSYYLEDAATEFQVQGLELDWVCVTWDADFRFTSNGWAYHDFRGNRWCNIANADNRNYLRNAYRVLLTRARQGMAVFVPAGDTGDPTRKPEYYDRTFAYLKSLGIPEI